ncbi:N-acetylneuraminate synthase family protein [Neptuniibacter sp.]|uniref:N-acetylneuraminate synthase family protein n=1 Tax=Neptuniibacter sp. TaxID=1962643 RepID=UPI00262B9ABA|nr:N-acetylneuraminate synthase family protein [Neptuniibacter sp.]
MGIAKKLIDVAYAAGCDYVKFQKRTVDKVYSKEELDAPRQSPWGTTNREQKEGLEFNFQDYVAINEYCTGKIKWFASPWDVDSFHFLMDLGVPMMKVPSALITDTDILKACVANEIPTILSTGMSTEDEISAAQDLLHPFEYCTMHCTSTYPTVPEEINVGYMRNLKYASKIGFSNHYPGLMAMCLAVAYGAEMIEMHVTLDRTMYGSDQAASIEPAGVFELMRRIELIEKMMGDGRKVVYDSELPIIEKLRT